MDRLVLTLTGQSCAGKSTLERKLCATGHFGNVVSTTTRPMREGEVNGIHYWFVSKDEFQAMESSGELLESVVFNGNQYGGSKSAFEKVFAQGKSVIIVAEPHGVQQINESAPLLGWKTINAFIGAKSEVLAARFLARFKSDEKASIEVYARRLAVMMEEEREWRDACDYTVRVDGFGPENEDQVIRHLLSQCGIPAKTRRVVRGNEACSQALEF